MNMDYNFEITNSTSPSELKEFSKVLENEGQLSFNINIKYGPDMETDLIHTTFFGENHVKSVMKYVKDRIKKMVEFGTEKYENNYESTDDYVHVQGVSCGRFEEGVSEETLELEFDDLLQGDVNMCKWTIKVV
jgi:hypothetical protein